MSEGVVALIIQCTVTVATPLHFINTQVVHGVGHPVLLLRHHSLISRAALLHIIRLLRHQASVSDEACAQLSEVTRARSTRRMPLVFIDRRQRSGGDVGHVARRQLRLYHLARFAGIGILLPNGQLLVALHVNVVTIPDLLLAIVLG